MNKVIKRDGKIVDYNPEKIKLAIQKAIDASELEKNEIHNEELVTKIIKKIELEKKEKMSVEQIQDLIERNLLKLEPVVGKNFLIYRRERTKIRNKKQNAIIHELISIKPGDLVNENANMAAETPSGMISKIGFETSKEYSSNNCLQLEYKIEHDSGNIHIHDLDWYLTGSLTCCASEVENILKSGFMDSHGGARGAKRLNSAVRLCAISMQKSQNLQHGAQMIPALDFYLAPYVIMSFKEHLKALISDFDCLDLEDIKELNEKKVEQYKIKDVFELKGKERIWQLAINKTVKEAKQAMEGMIHDLNLMASRAGTQVPLFDR
jgi:ribonucleoside-triphosphate reductase